MSQVLCYNDLINMNTDKHSYLIINQSDYSLKTIFKVTSTCLILEFLNVQEKKNAEVQVSKSFCNQCESGKLCNVYFV